MNVDAARIVQLEREVERLEASRRNATVARMIPPTMIPTPISSSDFSKLINEGVGLFSEHNNPPRPETRIHLMIWAFVNRSATSHPAQYLQGRDGGVDCVALSRRPGQARRRRRDFRRNGGSWLAPIAGCSPDRRHSTELLQSVSHS
jgi:hypothetical protein